MSVVDTIGVISGLLTIVGFGMDNFGNEDTSGSTIKVAVALDGPHGPTNAGGGIPDVRVWNEVGKFVGMKVDPGTVGNGDLGTVDVDHDNQGVYTLFSANDDAICVAWVTTTWSDDRGGNKYAVSGDYGHACGGQWYHSHMYPNNGKDYQPKCFWIDKNGDQPKTGFQVRWPAFAKDQQDANHRNPKRMCNGIDFGLRTEKDPHTIHYYTKGKRSSPLRARQPMARPAWAESELVVSDSKHHSAKELCQSDTSVGPDFVHVEEGLFCDMSAKVLYAFCTEDGKTDCFDFDSHTVLSGKNETHPVDTTDVAATSKKPGKYSSIRDWRSNSTKAAA